MDLGDFLFVILISKLSWKNNREKIAQKKHKRPAIVRDLLWLGDLLKKAHFY